MCRLAAILTIAAVASGCTTTSQVAGGLTVAGCGLMVVGYDLLTRAMNAK